MQKIFIYLSALLSISSCSSTNTGHDKNIDPYKETNEKIFELNQHLDKHITKPIAQAYDYLLPDYIEARISSFFSNLGEISVIGNDLMQAKFHAAADDTTRFLINSSFGMFGLFDMATENGFPKHTQNFALTLDYWGFQDSPYIVMPILGSSTVFDAVAIPVDKMAMSPITYVDPYSTSASIRAANNISFRAEILPYDDIILDAFDPYIMARNAYLQTRKKEITENAKFD